MSSASEARRTRRNDLADWLYREAPGAPYTTAQIVDVSGIYDGMQGRWDTCHRDLLRLKSNGVVISTNDQPTRWAHARA
jgi:hypothetical protein